MSRRSKRPVEKLDLVYSRKRDDIEEVMSDMFGGNESPNVLQLTPAAEAAPNQAPAGPTDGGRSGSPENPIDTGAVTPGITLLPATDDLSTLPRPAIIPIPRSTETPGITNTPVVSMPPRDTMSFGDTPPLQILDLSSVPRSAQSSGIGFRARIVQDAHTIWEQALYEALWDMGIEDADGSRTVCAGYRTLATQTRLGDKTVKRNLRSLEEKLAIEPIAPEDTHTSTGRTYRVYSLRQVLERRRQAELEWVIRNRQGVTLTKIPAHLT